ncbi:MAG TPA: hypothetical protein VH054_22790 [Polyangiaceae bacterium]|nr:hypothetical protein [Polyangiaceae bacterium]
MKKERRLLIAAAIAVVGGLGGLALWAFAAPEEENLLDVYEQSKRYQADLERVGGKAAVLGDDIQRWLASLFHGPNLGLTICALSFLAAGAFLFFTRPRK